MRAEV